MLQALSKNTALIRLINYLLYTFHILYSLTNGNKHFIGTYKGPITY